ncbi:MAG: DUF924 family protein [Burkholderiales bacterium]
MSGGGKELADEVLRFWFGAAAASIEAAQARSKVWFKADPAFDAELTRRFGGLPERARARELDSWAGAPESALARILVLDQFPRNLFRGTRDAFAFDALAAAAATEAVGRGFDAQLHPLMASFVYLPFEHAESSELQARAVACFEALQARAPQGLETMFAGFTDYAHRHRVLIERFGRFPHRNAILGRCSTPEEIAYLEGGAERFGVPAG